MVKTKKIVNVFGFIFFWNHFFAFVFFVVWLLCSFFWIFISRLVWHNKTKKNWTFSSEEVFRRCDAKGAALVFNEMVYRATKLRTRKNSINDNDSNDNNDNNENSDEEKNDTNINSNSDSSERTLSFHFYSFLNDSSRSTKTTITTITTQTMAKSEMKKMVAQVWKIIK